MMPTTPLFSQPRNTCQILHTKWLWCLLVQTVMVFLALAMLPAKAAVPDSVTQNGLAWLQAQVSPSGDLVASSNPTAIKWQAQSEAFLAMKAFNQTPPAALADRVLGQSGMGATEILARQILVSSASAAESATLQDQLKAAQSTNSGWGATSSYSANVLDTAYALLALNASSNTSGVSQGLAFLRAQQYSSGGFGLPSLSSATEQPSVFTTSLSVLALAAWRTQFDAGTSLSNAQRWLLSARTGSAYASSTENALALFALSRQTSDSTVLQPIVDALVNAQLPNGSWAGDVYVTALALRALGSYSVAPPTPTTGSLAGSVVDQDNGRPLQNVTVSLTGSQSPIVASGSDGSFSLYNINPGSYTISLSLSGYATVQASITVTAGQVLNVGVVRLKPAPNTSNLKGIVKNSSGSALANALVAVGSSSALSDSTGAYSITGIEAGTRDVVVSLSGYASVTASLVFAPGQSYVFSPTLGNAGVSTSLVGTVIDADTNAAIANATIALGGASTTTAANGSFTLGNLTPGAFSVTVSAGGYPNSTYAGTLLTGTNNLGVIRLAKQAASPTTASLSGVVKNTGGTALAGVTISVGAVSVKTDATGAYQLSGIAPAYSTIKASLAGYTDISLVVNFEAGKNYVFSPVMGSNATYATLQGKVVDGAGGAAIPGSTISIGGLVQTAGAGGSFVFKGLNPGPFTINISATGYQPVTLTGTMTLGVNDVGSITLTKAATTRKLSGVVTDAVSQAPIAGATLSIAGLATTATSAADGRYSFDAVAGSGASLTAAATGYVTQTFSLSFGQAGDANFDVELSRPIASRIAINHVQTDKPLYDPFSLITVEVELQNGDAQPASLLVEADVLDPQNKVVYTFMANASAGWAGVRQPNQPIMLPANGSLTAPMEWHVLRQPAGTYQVRARAIDGQGRVVAEGQTSFEISSVAMMNGGVTTNPPLVQYGTNQAVALSVNVTNVGNQDIPAGNVDVQVILDTPDATGNNQAITQAINFASGSPLNNPRGLARDSAGNLYTVNYADGKVLKFDASGVVSVLATLPGGSYANGFALASNGDLWIVGNQLYQVTAGGAIGAFKIATLSSLTSIGIDSNGTLIIGGVSKQTGQPQIIRRDSAGLESVLYTGGLANPYAFVKDDAGNYVVTNYGDSTLTKVSLTDGSISPFVAYAKEAGSLNRPRGITRDATGNFFVANSGADNVIKVTPTGQTSVYASGFKNPQDVKFDAAGNLFVSSSGDNTIYTVAPSGVVSVYVRGGVAVNPQGMKYDDAGNLWIANNDGTLRVLASSGESSIVATGMSSPRGLAIDSSGNAYVANYANGTVQKVSNGQVTTFASGLTNPWGVAIDGNGSLWVSEYGVAGRLKAFDVSGVLQKTVDSMLVSPNQVRIGKSGQVFVRSSDRITIIDAQGPRILYRDPNVVMETIVVDPSTGNLLAKRGFDLYRIDIATGVATKFATLPNGKSWYGIAADSSGNAYSIDYYAKVVNKVTSAGATSAFSSVLPNYVSSISSGLDGKPTVYYSNNVYYQFAADGVASEYKLTAPGNDYIYRLAMGAAGEGMGIGYSKTYLFDASTQVVVKTLGVGLYGQSDMSMDEGGNIFAVSEGERQLYKVDAGTTSLSLVLSGLYYPQDIAFMGNEMRIVGGSNQAYKYALNTNIPERLPGPVYHSGYIAVVNGTFYTNYSSSLYKYESNKSTSLASVGYTVDGGVAAKANAIASASSAQSRLTVMDGAGKPMAQYAGIVSPQGMAVDSSGQLLVASYGNSSVVKVSAPNQSSWFGAVSYPQSLAVDSQDQLWAVSGSSVLQLNAQGSVTKTLNLGFSGYSLGFDGSRMVIPNYSAHQMGEWAVDHWQPFSAGLSSAPVAMAVDSSNTVWLASGNNGSLLTLQNGVLQTKNTGLTNLSALRLGTGGLYLGGTGGWVKLRDGGAGTLTDLKLDAFTNSNPIQGLATSVGGSANSSLYALVGGSQNQILKVDTTRPVDPPPAGTVAYQTTVPMQALPTADGYQTLDLGQWLPPYGGDFKVVVTRSGVQSSLTNYIHVGPHATSDLQALKTELPPGDPELPMCMNLDGADFTSISRVEIANVKPLVNTGFPQGLTSDRSGNIFYTDTSTLYKYLPGQKTGTPLTTGITPSFGLATDSAETMYVSSRNSATGNYDLIAITPDGTKRKVVDLGVNRTNGLVVNSQDEVIIASPGKLLKVNKQGQLTVVPTNGLPAPRGIAIDGKDNVYAQNDNSGQLISMMKPSGAASVIFNGADGVNNPVFEGDGYPNIAADCAENFYIAPYQWEKINQRSSEEHTLAQVIPRTGKVAVLFDALKINPAFNDIDFLSYDRLGNRLLVWNHGDGNVWGVPVTCGAISVDVHLFAKPGQTLTGSSKAPVATIVQADGRTEYVWSLKDVTSSGAQICFDASQKGLKLGELRSAIDSGYMSFQNSFAPAPVKAPIAIPDVRGANLVGISVATDLAEYPAQATAQVTTSLNNANVRDITGTLTVEVFDGAGQIVGRVTQQGVTLPSQGNLPVTGPFAIGSIVPAKYTVKATLSDADLVLAQAQSDFNVLTDQANASAISQVSTDRSTYKASDRVQIASIAISKSANLIMDNLTLVVKVYDPTDTLIYSHGYPVAQLLPGALMNFAGMQALQNAAPGIYTVKQDLMDAQSRVIHSTQTSYGVGVSANTGFGLTGTIAALPQTVRIGESVKLVATAVNQGNSALTNLPLEIWVIDPASQTVVHQYGVTTNLDVAVSTSLTDAWVSAGTDGQELMAVLVATINAGSANPTQLTLAQDHFSLVAPQSQTIVPTGGTPQNALVNTAFTSQLQATVTRNNGIPVAGAEVTFMAAPGNAGSVTFPAGNTAITNAQGQAAIAVSAGAATGSAKVIATTPVAIGSAMFDLMVTPTVPVCGKPNPVFFLPITGATPFSLQQSNGVLVSGLGKGCTVTASVNTGAFSVLREGQYVTKATALADSFELVPRPVQDGDLIVLQMQAPAAGQTARMTLTLDSLPAEWSVSSVTPAKAVPLWGEGSAKTSALVCLTGLLLIMAYRRRKSHSARGAKGAGQ